MVFFQILFDIIFPIFVLILAGFALDRKFKVDLSTLGKLNFYVFIPVFMFIRIVQSPLSFQNMGWIAVFTTAHILVILLVAFPLFSLPGLRRNRPLLLLGAGIYNSGNYGIPLVILIFGDHLVGLLAVNILVQNLLTFTLGLFILHAGQHSLKKIMRDFLSLPIFYSIAAALIVKYFEIPIPRQVEIPLDHIAGGMVSIALLTLGSQLSRSKFFDRITPVLVTLLVRFVLSPVIALLVCLLIPVSQEIKNMLILVSSLPVAVNVNILAMETGKDPELASQMVFWSTVVSALAVPILIMLLESF